MAEDRVLIPVQQDIIDFDGYPVMGIRLPDGRIGASLRDMCDAMKIDRPSQVQRIRGDETIAESLVSVQTQTRGGPQTADFLTAWAIPYWLTGIELARIKDEQKRQAILLFKRKAADVLYQHFSQPSRVPELSRTVVPVEPTAPAPNANALAWAEYHRQMVAFYEWKAATDTRIVLLEERQDTIMEWQESVESRLDEHRRVLAFIPDILDRLGPETLTPQHQKTLQYYVKQLHEATGKPYPTIYEDLKTAFAVPRYQELPEAEWANVINWFKVQIDRNKK
jgi:P22_AR N-terminal domain